MVLREARIKFTLFFIKLVEKAVQLGYEPAFDEVTNHQGTGHKKNSVHYEGCAGDLLLYKEGRYLIKTEEYQPLGEYWEGLDPDCKWGGRFGDGNHFSYVPIEIFGGRK